MLALILALQIEGTYLEARNCDVWTGPCFANGEMNLRGDVAIAAWGVTRGSWEGVTLDGLRVAVVLKAEGTLHTNSEGKIRTALYVDEGATSEQAKALTALARHMAPQYTADIVATERRAIGLKRESDSAELTIGSEGTIKTSGFSHCDRICCNESQFYPAICARSAVDCAKSLEFSYSGSALGKLSWKEHDKRSAMVGAFKF